MNKILLSVLSVLFFLPALCQQRSDEAMRYAAQKQWRSMCRRSVVLQPAADLRPLKRTSALTVYGTPGQGFVITARSKHLPAVLAYSDSKFPEENLPDGLQWWMDRIGEAVEHSSYSAPAIEDYTPVEPLLKTTWAQESPYNALCPRIGGAWGSTPLTGCVATAMAQILKYF